MDTKVEELIPDSLSKELAGALSGMTYGSIELYVQDKVVTQITIRSIKKTSVNMKQRTNHVTATPLKGRISTSGKIQIKLRP